MVALLLCPAASVCEIIVPKDRSWFFSQCDIVSHISKLGFECLRYVWAISTKIHIFATSYWLWLLGKLFQVLKISKFFTYINMFDWYSMSNLTKDVKCKIFCFLFSIFDFFLCNANLFYIAIDIIFDIYLLSIYFYIIDIYLLLMQREAFYFVIFLVKLYR